MFEDVQKRKNDKLIEEMKIKDKADQRRREDEMTFDCQVCMDKKKIKTDCCTLNCTHKCCNDCMAEHIKTQIDSLNHDIKCPMGDCKSTID